jgi:hypothetical protein
MWALLWSADPHFSKQDVAKLSNDGKWAHWSLPSLLKALKMVSPESYEHVGLAGEALLQKPAWRAMFNDTKAAQNALEQHLPDGEIKDLVVKTEALLDAVAQEVARNLEKQANLSVEKTLD